MQDNNEYLAVVYPDGSLRDYSRPRGRTLELHEGAILDLLDRVKKLEKQSNKKGQTHELSWQ